MKELIIFSGEFSGGSPLPFASGGVKAGFPSPAQDYMAESLDFDKDLIEHPAATFYARVVGDSMIDAGINEGDIVVTPPEDAHKPGCCEDAPAPLKKICVKVLVD